MLMSTMFLVFAIYVFVVSLRLLREFFQQRAEGEGETDLGLSGRGMRASGLIIWFSAGVIAFMTGMAGFTEVLIQALQ